MTFAQALALSIILTGCVPCKPYSSKVKSVGGCDNSGFCSAILEDGTVLRDRYQPVVGEPVTETCKGRL